MNPISILKENLYSVLKNRFSLDFKFAGIVTVIVLIIGFAFAEYFCTNSLPRLSIEVVSAVIGVLLIYFYVSWKEFSEKAEISTGYQAFEDAVRTSQNVFMTSVMPGIIPSFERRFSPDLVRQMSILAGRYTKTNNFIKSGIDVTVVIYEDEEKLQNLKLPIFEGKYAKQFAMMFNELGFDLAIIKKSEFIATMKENEILVNESDLTNFDFAICENSKDSIIFTPKGSIKESNIEYITLTNSDPQDPDYNKVAKTVKTIIYDPNGQLIDKYCLNSFLIK